MSKFLIEYQVEATNLASATATAHEWLHNLGETVDSVRVVPVKDAPPPFRTFGDPITEVNPRVAESVWGAGSHVS